MSVRLRKIVRDLWLQRGRGALVVMAMALGVFGVVWISSSSAVLSRELRAQYLATDPASATIIGTGLTPELAAEVRGLPGVAAAETATTMSARVRVGPSDYVPLRLFARTDFAANTIANQAKLVGNSLGGGVLDHHRGFGRPHRSAARLFPPQALALSRAAPGAARRLVRVGEEDP
jgi:hypothetical protein